MTAEVLKFPPQLSPAGAGRSRDEAKAPSGRKGSAARKFFEIDQVNQTSAGGWKLINDEQVFSRGGLVFFPPEGRRGFREYPVTPIFLLDSKIGRAIRDIERIHGYWLISEKTKAVFSDIDPEAFAYLECLTQLRDGSEGPRYWLCDVVRELDCIDEAASNINIGYNVYGKYYYFVLAGKKIVIEEDVVRQAHIFRPKFTLHFIVCDESIKSACKAAGVQGFKYTKL